MNINELIRQKRIHGLKQEVTEQEKMMLKQGVPVQKIIGFINFDNLQINVNHNVLIPRYETEEVLHACLPFINKNSRVLDLCCGSGYLGLSIKHKTNADVVLSDMDDEAILQTQENAQLNNLHVQVIKSDLFDNIQGKFDLIVSNPPYIPDDHVLDESVVKHEPKIALFGGKDGNDFYKKIIAQAPNFLTPQGVLVLEISPDNVHYLASQGFEIKQDINQKDRIAIKRMPWS